MRTEETQLIRRAQSGDRQAFDKLVKENKDKMFALIYRMTEDRETALDLLQDTFISAWKAIGRFKLQASFSSWLYRIASNKSLNHIRRSKIVPFLSLDSSPSSEPTYEMTDNVEKARLQNTMAIALKGLPPQQKLAFNLRFYDELPFGEIAGIMDKSESTVKTHFQKAVEKLRVALKDFRD